MTDTGGLVHINPIVRRPTGRPIPVSVNYFPHRQCNYACVFCFHTNLSSTRLSLPRAQEGLRMLAAAGMKKLNISGGEPFLHAQFLGKLLRFAKEELQLEGTGVICNGSLVTQAWIDEYGDYLDFMGVSCDSFDEETNEAIGRRDGRGRRGMHWRKMNTVVNRHNWQEDMTYALEEIKPERWKVFQVLLLEGENVGPDALRNAQDVVITSEEFQAFLARHAKYNPVAEDNDAMENSYLLLDEEMRFLNCQGGRKRPGRSIFDVGVEAALDDAGWEPETFVDRGGIFDWGNPKPSSTDW
ncbi:radical SAM enzyme [Dentipellis sp. KUC8613]|nr:radical SAM enzyme [Dentipellis sp. KUC8613]